MSRAFTPTVGGLYSLGRGDGITVLDGAFIESDALNTQDLGSAGAPDFADLGPGSQVWYLGYAVRVNIPQAIAPTDPLGLVLTIRGSSDTVVPFGFFPTQEIRLPVYGTSVALQAIYSGKARVEWPVAQIDLTNNLGQSVVLSYQFWGKAF